MTQTLSLDHVGVVVKDLAQARTVFQRLGFRLTPLSFHRGLPQSSGPGPLLGSGNHCAILEKGYIEVIGVTDPTKPTPIDESLARYQGTHTIAFAANDIDTAYNEAVARGLKPIGPIHLERSAAWGFEGEEKPAVFKNIYFDASQYPESRPLLIEHKTPDVIWQPCFKAHQNHAIALLSITIMAHDLPKALDRYRGLLGSSAEPQGTGTWVFKKADTSVLLCDENGLQDWFPNLEKIEAGYTAGFTLGTRDVEATHKYLSAAGIPGVKLSHGRLGIEPSNACSTAIVFQQI